MAGNKGGKANGDGNDGMPWQRKVLALMTGAGLLGGGTAAGLKLASDTAVCVQ